MKNKKILFFSKLTILAAVLLRCVQLFFFTEEITGFFIPEYKAVSAIMSFVIIALLIVPFALAFSGRRQPSHPPAHYRSISIAAFIVAAAILIEVLTNGFAVSVSPLLVLPYRLFGILGAASFIAYGLLAFINNFNFLRGFLVAAVVFLFFRLILSFSCYSALASMADSYFDIFMQCSLLVFALYFAKSVCFIKTESSCFAVLPTALLAIGFSAVNVVPKLLMYVVGKGAVVYHTPVYLLTNLALGIFAAVYTHHLFSSKNFTVKEHSTKILPKDVVDVSDDSFLTK